MANLTLCVTCETTSALTLRPPFADDISNFKYIQGFKRLWASPAGFTGTLLVRQTNCMQQNQVQLSLMDRSSQGRRWKMRERFSVTELAALRNDLLQGGLADSREAAELVQIFLMGRGYGVSPQAARDAVSRVEMSGCALPVLEKELEGLALVQ
jgi:hypothetical protein